MEQYIEDVLTKILDNKRRETNGRQLLYTLICGKNYVFNSFNFNYIFFLICLAKIMQLFYIL